MAKDGSTKRDYHVITWCGENTSAGAFPKKSLYIAVAGPDMITPAAEKETKEAERLIDSLLFQGGEQRR